MGRRLGGSEQHSKEDVLSLYCEARQLGTRRVVAWTYELKGDSALLHAANGDVEEDSLALCFWLEFSAASKQFLRLAHSLLPSAIFAGLAELVAG